MLLAEMYYFILYIELFKLQSDSWSEKSVFQLHFTS